MRLTVELREATDAPPTDEEAWIAALGVATQAYAEAADAFVAALDGRRRRAARRRHTSIAERARRPAGRPNQHRGPRRDLGLAPRLRVQAGWRPSATKLADTLGSRVLQPPTEAAGSQQNHRRNDPLRGARYTQPSLQRPIVEFLQKSRAVPTVVSCAGVVPHPGLWQPAGWTMGGRWLRWQRRVARCQRGRSFCPRWR
jgi:hypothetical protein